MEKSELYKQVANKLNISEEVVKEVDKHIFDQLRLFMIDSSKYEFQINNFGVFTPKLTKIQGYIRNNKDTESKRIQKKIIKYKEIVKLGLENNNRKKQNGKKRNRQD